MKFLLGTKQRMTQIFDDNGQAVVGTVLAVAPAMVVQVKTADKNQAGSVQIGYGEKRAKNTSKAERGHIAPALKASGKENIAFQYLREFTTDNSADYKIGDPIDLSIFNEGDTVEIAGTSKGKGFQGVVKRHGFKGGRRSHGQKHSEREPGSIGVGGVQRVFKGMRMAGRMGSDRITLKNVKIVKINQEAKEILVKGAVPGRPGSLVEIVMK
ncbi:MAG: 50S ribosomal protein L3 [Parcubacteria group bacterium GW2011_GWA1_43_21]|uniref:50S ribosomal protein L3 n=2 Tax=Candidatus Vogeliibacteriota TaxID=1817922 RepID=A0A1G2QBN3_9BACT|nr:MAG: 50S ribosomal protein L3 [Parcubacteria group bacterium GW2011_GWB1_42_9]KKT09757.1 MAG: 50S ribosomal protein L3 [Parcubacteria group bacterium GW2011_GWA1_43_21]OHA57970.1 MAG: 50S ribosomal protein L3 [Candidatus Vogelbacteria bacterium RIFOXYB1_FULL_42_16]OHA59728.1 MAG: 50S ribosomal protein L3 [Candidatus Vogelbacteria bacterium RIFOXYD1_FULL_42_15]